jgi:DNA-binding response OmpR family regulator
MAKRILVVDDEPHIVKIVASRLKANGYEVITAGDGMEGIEKAKKDKPDLILLDIAMPTMTGQEALKKLKEDKDTKSIPVIMLTGRSGAEDIVKCIAEGGAKDYIVKPFMAGDFLKKINTVLAADKRLPESTFDQELLDTIDKKVKKILDEKKQN